MKSLDELLKTFGLDNLERQVYVFLVKRGWSTALQISRGSNVKRTTLYRVLARLESKGLVETKLDEKTTYYAAGDLRVLEESVTRHEEEAVAMRWAYDDLAKQLKKLGQVQAGETGVRFYRGVKGLQAMEWKMCERGNKEVLLFGGGSWHSFLGDAFAEEIRAEMVAKKIRIRELINRKNTEPVADDGTTSWTANVEYVKHYFRHRIVPEKLMKITQDIMIFDEIIHLGSFRDDELMGVEIESKQYAEMLRALFEIVWAQASEIDKYGGDFN